MTVDAVVRRVAEVLRPMLRFRRPIGVALQLAVVVLSTLVAFQLRFDGHIPREFADNLIYTLPLLLAIRAFTFVPFRLYQGLWRYTSIHDLLTLVQAIAASSLLFLIVMRTVFSVLPFPRTVMVIDAGLLLLALGGLRLCRRLYVELSHPASGRSVLIVGAGDAGELIVRDMKNSSRAQGYRPIGFIDDDTSKVGKRIHGVPVLGTRRDIASTLEKYRPAEVLIAIPRADAIALRSVIRAFEPHKIPIKTLPNLRDIVDGKVQVTQIRDLTVEDLLTRAPVGLDIQPVKHLIRGRRVLVTGAGGSIGSELCRQIAILKPAALVILDRYENSLHAIRLELGDTAHGYALHPVIADVTDEARVESILDHHRPEILFHAAAHKHVPLMEENPCEAIKNNVRGTRILAEAAERYGIDRFILISTDKAVNPVNVMGASKRLAELIVQAQAVGSGTSYSIVRFGNVLGSNGSVVPRFLEQIRKGGPVTVTHPDMRRFFMLIPEAVQLVLHAAAQAESGATYVLDMGEQVKLLDMARDMIRASGFIPEDEIPIEFVGLRPGEKLYEELVGTTEEAKPSKVDKILCVTSKTPPSPYVIPSVAEIERLAVANDVPQMLESMKRLIAGFGESPAVPPAPQPMTSESITFAELSVESKRPCPKCHSAEVHRSRAQNFLERRRRNRRQERLYRCSDCGWRGWLLPLDLATPNQPLIAALTPDLSSLDAAVAVTPSKARGRVSPRDLS